MVDESDKSLFRNAVNEQMPIDKDADKEETYNNKKHWNKPFEDYSYLPKPNLSASDSIRPVSYTHLTLPTKRIV